MDRRIAEVRSNIRQLEDQLRNGSSSSIVSAEPARQHRPRGENLRLVRELFEKEPEATFTMQEIAEHTGVGISSVQAVLKKEDAGFVKNLDGKWEMSQGIEISAPTPAKPR